MKTRLDLQLDMIDTTSLLDKNGRPSSRKLTIQREALHAATSWMREDASLAERLWILHHGYTEYPKKCHCGQPVRWSFWSTGYQNDFCGVSCWQDVRKTKLTRKLKPAALTKEERVKRQEESNLKKYGVRWPWMAEAGKKARAAAVKQKSVHQWFTALELRGLTPLFSEDEYVSGAASRHKLLVQCTCGTEFAAQRYKEGSNPGLCPTCYTPRASRWQHELNDFIRDLGVETRLNDRTVLGNGYEIDIWIPSAKLGIECDGAWWHSEGGRPDIKAAMLKKHTLAMHAGIRLISVFDFEFIEKRKIVEGRIRAALKMPLERIGARSTAVRELSKDEAASFFNEAHLQGQGVGTTYALYKDHRILCAMSVAKPRWGDYDLEIIRLSSTPGVLVNGGASKLFSFICKKHEPKTMISYADLRWGDGQIYEKLGFTDAGETGPAFFYVNSNNQRASRYQMQAAKLHGHGTELEKTAALGYYRVWTIGHRRWVFGK